jgi:hypothetical protein
MHVCPLTPLHIEGKRNAIADVPSRSFGSNPAWACASNTDLLNLFNSRFPLPQQKSWTVYHPNCAVVMRVISALRMKPFCSGRLEATSNKREMCWRNWCAYVKHFGVDPYLQQVSYSKQVRCLTGFAAQMRTGFYAHGQQVQSSTVASAFTAVGQTIALACNENPTKVLGSEKFLPALQIMINGYTKADPPMQKNYQSKRMFRNS